MYATSNPALRCQVRTSSASQSSRPSCEYFVCAWKSTARMFGPAVSSAAIGRGTSERDGVDAEPARRARSRRAPRSRTARRAGGMARSVSRRLHHHQSAQPSTSVTTSATCCRTLSSVSVSSMAEIGARSRYPPERRSVASPIGPPVAASRIGSTAKGALRMTSATISSGSQGRRRSRSNRRGEDSARGATSRGTGLLFVE